MPGIMHTKFSVRDDFHVPAVSNSSSGLRKAPSSLHPSSDVGCGVSVVFIQAFVRGLFILLVVLFYKQLRCSGSVCLFSVANVYLLSSFSLSLFLLFLWLFEDTLHCSKRSSVETGKVRPNLVSAKRVKCDYKVVKISATQRVKWVRYRRNFLFYLLTIKLCVSWLLSVLSVFK